MPCYYKYIQRSLIDKESSWQLQMIDTRKSLFDTKLSSRHKKSVLASNRFRYALMVATVILMVVVVLGYYYLWDKENLCMDPSLWIVKGWFIALLLVALIVLGLSITATFRAVRERRKLNTYRDDPNDLDVEIAQSFSSSDQFKHSKSLLCLQIPMITEQPLLKPPRHELGPLLHLYSTTSSQSPSPPLSLSLSEDDCGKCSGISPLTTPPSSPSMDRHPQTLFRLLPVSPISYGIKLGTWISVTLELLSEYGGFQYEANTKNNFKLKDGQAHLPLDCSLLFEWKGQISSQSPPNCSLVLEKRALQSAHWHGLESLSGPGIGSTGRGGLEFRVAPTHEQAPMTFWISISSERDQRIVPLVFGPLTTSSDVCHMDDARQVLRPISIPRCNGQSPRTMLLKETWNNVPQGRVWDSAFVLIDIFSKKVVHNLYESAPAIFAGKRILDLSAGTGLLGIFLAGLAQVELESCNENSSSSTQTHSPLATVSADSSSLPCTTVMLTDLEDALDLINFNINSNQHRIAPSINIVAEQLVWGTANLARLDVGEFDIVIASDVVYEVESFNSLLETFCGLCTPRRTILYLGYKRRYLAEDKEYLFFERIKDEFDVIETLYELDVQIWCLRKRVEQ
ncbi:Methyltransferase-like protein 21A [Haplosporangium sp. Z 27]|nr:Methyltransferase-like protein 21A [Haplosporangium sp. Z 27]